MTKREFLTRVPGLIVHKSWGEGEIEIVTDTDSKKGVCYRHHDNTASCGTYAATWSELHQKLTELLLREGLMSRK